MLFAQRKFWKLWEFIFTDNLQIGHIVTTLWKWSFLEHSKPILSSPSWPLICWSSRLSRLQGCWFLRLPKEVGWEGWEQGWEQVKMSWCSLCLMRFSHFFLDKCSSNCCKFWWFLESWKNWLCFCLSLF